MQQAVALRRIPSACRKPAMWELLGDSNVLVSVSNILTIRGNYAHTPIPGNDYQLLQQLRESQQEAKQLFLRLTPCEQQVLELIANGLPNKAIASLICRSIKTVEKHRSKLMKKLGLASVCEVLRFWCRLRWDEFILGPPTQYPLPFPHNEWILHETTRSATMTSQAADFLAFHNPTR